ncbi:MAG: MBL fold metallo-hydrolase [Bacteriovoracaceae bacterium]|nr:MBL fold metallo-hydrolase [Bacteriovoracaceae bacterium]
MDTLVLHPSTFKLDGGAMFGIIPKPLWEKKIKSDDKNRILMSLRVILFITENKKILVDTGIGEYHDEKFIKNFEISNTNKPLISILEANNIYPDEISDIILTHLHFDHVGGLGDKDGNPLFKNATIHLHKKHLEYAKKPSDKDAGSFHSKIFLPLLEKHKLNLLTDLNGIIIKDGKDEIKYKTSFGHTPYMIHPYNNKYIYMADLVPMEHHIPIPWVMGYDIEPVVTTKYKKEFYHFIQKEDLTMIFEHDNETVGAKVVLNEKRRFKGAEKLHSQKKAIEKI